MVMLEIEVERDGEVENRGGEMVKWEEGRIGTVERDEMDR